MPDTDDLLRRLHDVYHAGPDADMRLSEHAFVDVQPGTAEHNAVHLVGSAAPESRIERWGPIGAEGFGPVEILDGRTGRPVARISSRNRRRMT